MRALQYRTLGAAPGAMAEFLLVDDPRHLVPLGDLDPVASLTPYHAIKQSLPKLVPGSTAVVIGVGGLGHVGVQIHRPLSATTIVAIDAAEQKLALAPDVGADHALLPGEETEARIRDLTGGKGATAVFDVVGAAVTIGFAARSTV